MQHTSTNEVLSKVCANKLRFSGLRVDCTSWIQANPSCNKNQLSSEMVEVEEAFSDTMVSPFARVVTEAELADAAVGDVEGSL